MHNPIYISVKDHSVSKEVFDLYRDPELDMLVTTPKPNQENLPRYYESDDYISHTDGKRSYFEKAYHFVKSISLKRKLNLIRSLNNSKGTLLDIGAGTGDFLCVAKNDGWAVTGIEPSAKAKAIAVSKGVVFSESMAAIPDHSVDVITMWHVLEHVSDLEMQIKELKRLLKPDGSIVIAVPNFKSFDAVHYGEYWAAYDVPRHLWHFSKTAIEKLFAKEALELTDVLPMKFDAFYVSLLSEKYKTGKMNYFDAFRIGLKSNQRARKSSEYSSHIYILRNAK